MQVWEFNQLPKEKQQSIREKLEILAAMTPAARSDWLLGVPKKVLLTRDAKGIFLWASDQRNITWNGGPSSEYEPMSYEDRPTFDAWWEDYHA
jgi:hypothetical protein